ncbi:hypothetical protein DMP08_08675 [Paraeggerthella hongkongensis]|uniref:Uncharacterized protein n=1 Tax=Paraeggerthella hongkongensis TaxID=230658 RepID=A0A3N0B6V8_9ACTN|nr:hypothetical protein DMP08_08675 [Paraeggerthella hongkongensis]
MTALQNATRTFAGELHEEAPFVVLLFVTDAALRPKRQPGKGPPPFLWRYGNRPDAGERLVLHFFQT